MQFSVNDAFNSLLRSPHLLILPMCASLPSHSGGQRAADDAKHAANYTWARASPAAFVPAGGKGFTWFSATLVLWSRFVRPSIVRSRLVSLHPIGAGNVSSASPRLMLLQTRRAAALSVDTEVGGGGGHGGGG